MAQKRITFVKMHGIGNDYVYVDCFRQTVEDPADLARRISPRRFGVGSDGLILILPSAVADAKMRMFNADGSEGMMCGNGIRCVGKYLYDTGVAANALVTVETACGIKTLQVTAKDGKAVRLSVDMGKADFSSEAIPTAFGGEMIDEPIAVGGETYRLTAVSVGNPHAVIFCESVDSLPLEEIGPLFENHALFPKRVNTEFVRVISGTELAMRVWERGSGETLACGTGACAVVAAAVRNGICQPDTAVTVHLRGGDLQIRCGADGRLIMNGTAQKVYEGVYEYES